MKTANKKTATIKTTLPVKSLFSNVIKHDLSKSYKTPAKINKDFLSGVFNTQRARGFTTHVHKSSDKASKDVFEILCLAMGIISVTISWIPFVGFVTPAVSFMSAYKTKKKSNFRLAGIVLSLASVIICASIMTTLAVKPSVFGI